MKKKTSILLGLLLSLGCVVRGQSLSYMDATAHPHHMISAGNDALGFSSQTETYAFEVGNNAYKADTLKVVTSKLGLNYTYLFDNGVMLGSALYSKTTTRSSEKGNVVTSESEEVVTNLLFYTGYNFNSDFKNSWWIQGGIAMAKNSQKDTSAGVITESELSSSPLLFVRGGRRISLSSWGLPNVSYSPSIEMYSGALKFVYGNVNRQGRYSMVRVNFLSVDLLF